MSLKSDIEQAQFGDIITIPDGDYTLDSTIFIPSGVTIIGGPGVTITSNAYPAFELSDTVDVTLLDLDLRLEQGKGIIGDNVSGLIIDSINITGNHSTADTSNIAIRITNSELVTITNNIIEDNFGGIYVLDSQNTTIVNNSLSEIGFGNMVVSGDNINVVDNDIHRAGQTGAERGNLGGDGITIYHGDNIVISGNEITEPLCYGIWAPNGDVNHITITNNTITNGITSAIQLRNGASNIEITNNYLANNAHGISLIDSSQGLISDNILVNDTVHLNTTHDLILTNNFFEGDFPGKIITKNSDNTAFNNHFTSTPQNPQNQLPTNIETTDIILSPGEVFFQDVTDFFQDANDDAINIEWVSFQSSNGERWGQFSRGTQEFYGLAPDSPGTLSYVLNYNDPSGQIQTISFNLIVPDTATPEVFSGTGLDEAFNGGLGNDTIFANAGDDVLFSWAGDDFLDGGAGNDVLNGGAGNDTFIGGQGTDVHNGGDGHDIVDYSDVSIGTISINLDTGLANGYAASGDTFEDIEEIIATDRKDFLAGDHGDNTFRGGDGNDTLTGRWGDDTIYGENGNDRIYGGVDDDVVYGDAGNDGMQGGDGNDFMYGGTGNDVLLAGAGIDFLDGGAGDDIMNGGTGNDIFFGDQGADVHRGSTGHDIVDYSDVSIGAISINLDTGLANGYGASGDTFEDIEEIIATDRKDFLAGDHGDNSFRGGDGNDTLTGRWGDDTIYGDAGNDNLYGGTGNDVLFAGAGIDFLDGGIGNDRLVGGSSSDTFYFADGFGNDIISGFEDGLDLLWIQADVDSSDFNITLNAAGNVVVDFGTADNIEFLNITDVSLITADDFTFLS